MSSWLVQLFNPLLGLIPSDPTALPVQFSQSSPHLVSCNSHAGRKGKCKVGRDGAFSWGVING